MNECSLLGTWSLLGWYNESADGSRAYPLGKDATGHISYSPDGFVFVHISARDRSPYAVNDPFGGSPQEDAAAIKSQITYCGTYEIRGDRVIHRVTHASCPNWVGSEQVRNIEFIGDRLRLSAGGAVFQGQEVTAYVDWEKAVPAA